MSPPRPLTVYIEGLTSRPIQYSTSHHLPTTKDNDSNSRACRSSTFPSKPSTKMLTSKKTMATRHLHNHEMRLLVHLLSTQTSHIHPKTYKKDIKNLPRRLRCSFSTMISGSSNLCMMHSGLNHYLVNHIFSWVKYEFNNGIGRFLYPIIMSGKLSSIEEVQIRQLEPVLEMWHEDFKHEDSAPLGHTPIDRGSIFKYVKTSCTACILSRIGSHPEVLFALFAGMIGRFSCDQIFRIDYTLKELRPCHFNNIRSKRVRFVRYWMRATKQGALALPEAVDLGIKIKKIGEEVEWAKSAYSRNESLGGSTLREESVEPSGLCPNGNPSTYEEIHMKKACASAVQEQSTDDEKLGPMPRPQNFNRYSPLSDLGFHIGRINIRDSTTSTIYPESSMSRVRSVTPLPINQPTQARDEQQHLSSIPDLSNHSPTPRPPSSQAYIVSSISSASSIASYNNQHHPPSSSSSPSAPHRNRHYLFDPLATSTELVEKYRALLANNPLKEPEDEYVLPRPKRLSMYSAFEGPEERDPFVDSTLR